MSDKPAGVSVKSTCLHKGGENLPGVCPQRQGHVGVVDSNGHLVVFGGRAAGRGRTYLNDIWRFNPAELSWIEVKPTGTCPAVRHNHTGVVHEGSLYVFGGQTTNDAYLGDLWQLNLTTGQWDLVWDTAAAGTQGSPKARHAHGMAVHENTLYLFGGRDGYQPVHFDSKVFAFDIPTQRWRPIAATGQLPSGRSYANCVVAHNHLLVFGGYWWDGREHYLNDTYGLNLTTSVWSKINARGTIPAERNRGAWLALSKTGPVFLMGGNFFDSKTRKDKFFDDVHLLDITAAQGELECTWRRAFVTEGEAPSARGHQVCQVLGVTGTTVKVILFGGEAKRKRFNDLFILDINLA